MFHCNPFTRELFVYSGSTFDGCIALRDIHDKPFFISREDQIFFSVKKIIKGTNGITTEESLMITITSDDEINGEYPFKLNPDQTNALCGDYYYCAYLRFADGDYYQIVPHSLLQASVPHGDIVYSENKNLIYGLVPRVMSEYGYEPMVNEVMELIEEMQDDKKEPAVCIRHIGKADIIMTGSSFDTDQVTSSQLTAQISDMIEYYNAKAPFIAGFFHSSADPAELHYKKALKNAFGSRFIDVEEILKTPVYSEHSKMIISSIAIDLLRQKASADDIRNAFIHHYPECILLDETHFNEKGCYAAARAIVKEINKNVI